MKAFRAWVQMADGVWTKSSSAYEKRDRAEAISNAQGDERYGAGNKKWRGAEVREEETGLDTSVILGDDTEMTMPPLTLR